MAELHSGNPQRHPDPYSDGEFRQNVWPIVHSHWGVYQLLLQVGWQGFVPAARPSGEVRNPSYSPPAGPVIP